jgi:hypothetical protein
MRLKLPKINIPFFTRYINGDTFYNIKEHGNWKAYHGTNLQIAQDHPILTPAILFVAKLFSQADICVQDKKTGEKIYNHWILDLLKKPNYYQTQNDFLEAHNFTQIAEGKAVVWLRRTTGMSTPTSMYLLDPNLIEYPEEFRTNLSKSNKNNKVKNQKIIYDRDGENEVIPFRDLLFFYDLPNGLNTENMFETRSRLDGLRQTLINTLDSLEAKNVILKTNGKELITADAKAGSFPLTDAEKSDVEDTLQNSYGSGRNRKRGIVTKSNLKWQSLHIALRDLGLDESIKVDGNLIYTALHIPKDIISLEAKKTTYNNFKESMVSYIQNEMQPTLDSFLATMNLLIEDNRYKLIGTYEKMPIMQFILIERYDGIQKKAAALSMLRNAGIPDEIALEMAGFDSSIQLIERQEENNQQTQEENE